MHTIWIQSRSSPTMGAWIEIRYIVSSVEMHSRTPRWVRGLKLRHCWNLSQSTPLSHPTMGAWIENTVFPLNMFIVAPHDGCVDCDENSGRKIMVFGRTPRWVRGLKSFDIKRNKEVCRTPRWVRGLKFHIHFR